VPFDSAAPDVDEQQEPGENIEQYVLRLSLLKWRGVAARHPRSLVISADTTVEGPDGSAMHKPASLTAAKSVLHRLRGRTARVVTGVTAGRAADGSEPPLTILCISSVAFKYFTEAQLDDYVDSGLPLGKAGAFGLQDKLAAPLIASYAGCYTNIIGLPLCMIADAVRGCDILAANSPTTVSGTCLSPGCPLQDRAVRA
jgi:MAF protein